MTASPSYAARSRLCCSLVDLSEIAVDFSSIVNETHSQSVQNFRQDHQLSGLLHRALVVRDNIETFLSQELEQCAQVHCLSIRQTCVTTAQYAEPSIGSLVTYPDMLMGVLDCVANTVFINVDRMIYHLDQRVCQQLAEPESLAARSVTADPATVEKRRQRVRSSYNFVKAKSTLAAKPLDFGMRQIWSINGVWMDAKRYP